MHRLHQLARDPVVALLLLVLTATGCAVPADGGAALGDRAPGGDDAAVVVVTSTTVLADLVEQIGGDVVEVRSLVPVGGDPHVHEPRPSDAVAVDSADLVVDNGLGLSPWLGPLLGSRRGPVLDIGERLAEQTRSVDGRVDPHLWMVARVVAEHYVPAIVEALVALRPDAAQAIAVRGEALVEELLALDAEIAETLSAIPPERRLLVTSHDAYGYFADAYGLTVVGSVVGLTTEEEPSARTVAMLVEQIRRLDVPAVFIETTVNPDLIHQIAREAGVRVADPLYGDSLGPPGSGADSYPGMLRTNARTILTALTADEAR